LSRYVFLFDICPLGGRLTNTKSRRTFIPFATSGGSSIKKACADLKAAYPNLNWKEGKLLNRASKAELQKWVESNR